MALTMRNWFLMSEFVHSSCQTSVTDGFWWAGSTTRGAEMLIALLGAGTCLGIGVESDLRGSSPSCWLLPPRDRGEVEQYCSTLTAKVVV